MATTRLLTLCALLFSGLSSMPLGIAQERQKKTNLPEPQAKIEYKRVGEKPFYLHVFKPSQDSAQPRPAIVFFFGGGWSNGSPEQFYSQAKYLSDSGMVAFCADYRVKSRDDSRVIDCVADAQDAILYVRDHAKELQVDPNRIVAAGGSAGGHLAAATATVDYKGTQTNVEERFRPNALVLFNPALVLAPVEV